MSKQEKCPKCGAELRDIHETEGWRTWECGSYESPDGPDGIEQDGQCKDNQIATLAAKNVRLQAIVDDCELEIACPETLGDESPLHERIAMIQCDKLTLQAILDKLPSALSIACARQDLEATKGGCGSGTIACRLWNTLNGVVGKLEATQAKETVE